jgi:hypothetical protein
MLPLVADQQADQPRNPQPRRPQRSLRQWESSVDRKIREAQERGDFQKLDGYGKPIQIKEWQGEWAMAHHILKDSGETLPWIAMGREIDQRTDALRELLAEAANSRWALYANDIARANERHRLRKRFLERAAELDKLMVDYSFEIPIRDLDRGRLPPHIAAERFDREWPGNG